MGIKFLGFKGATGKGCGCCVSGCSCGSCTIPAGDLTVSWTNVIFGDGSILMPQSSICGWATSVCSHNVLFQLLCTSFLTIEFRVIYFVSGVCPTGQSDYCSTERFSPKQLVRTGLTCGSPFLMTISCDTACSNLQARGYTGFTVSS